MNLGNVYQIGKSRAIKKRTSLFLFTLEGSGITLDSQRKLMHAMQTHSIASLLSCLL